MLNLYRKALSLRHNLMPQDTELQWLDEDRPSDVRDGADGQRGGVIATVVPTVGRASPILANVRPNYRKAMSSSRRVNSPRMADCRRTPPFGSSCRCVASLFRISSGRMTRPRRLSNAPRPLSRVPGVLRSMDCRCMACGGLRCYRFIPLPTRRRCRCDLWCCATPAKDPAVHADVQEVRYVGAAALFYRLCALARLASGEWWKDPLPVRFRRRQSRALKCLPAHSAAACVVP